MVDRNEVLHRYRVQHESKRMIAREMGMHRKTVDKIISEYEHACLDEHGQCDLDALNALEGKKPRYHSDNRVSRVMTDAYKAIIRKCLEDNRVKRATGRRKLQMNCKDIYNRLVEEGFTGSYPCVCLHVGRIGGSLSLVPKPTPEVFVHREHDPGEECEFDWGEVPLEIAGVPVKAQLAAFSMPHSDGRHAGLYPRQDTLCFMEAHRDFFAKAGGVPRIMIYDNMRVAVTIKGKGRGRPCQKFPTASMRRLSLHYGFTERFCNARSGWEKGSVERSVEVIRHEAFVSRQKFASWEEARQWLEDAVARLNARSSVIGVSDAEKQRRIKADMDTLQPHCNPMGCWEAEERVPDKYCTVTVDSNHYSVPDSLIAEQVTVRIQSACITILHNGRQIARHTRLEGKGNWSMQLDHFLSTFLRKPGALDTSTALRQVPKEIADLYAAHFKGETQIEFIKLLLYMKDHSMLHSELIQAARRLRTRGIRHFTADHLRVEMLSARNATSVARDNDVESIVGEQRACIKAMSDRTVSELAKIFTNANNRILRNGTGQGS